MAKRGNADAATEKKQLDPLWTRRQVLIWGGISIAGIASLKPLLARGGASPLIIMEQARGIVAADPTRCVGCRRCELACTEFNDGKASPSIARIKVSRNLNFGPKGVFAGREGSATGETGWSCRTSASSAPTRCPAPTPAPMTPS